MSCELSPQIHFCLHLGESWSAQPIQNGLPILKDFLGSQVVVVRLKLKCILTQWYQEESS